jgi:peptidoglycan/LPS O-acetylase OafA/YrhL
VTANPDPRIESEPAGLGHDPNRGVREQLGAGSAPTESELATGPHQQPTTESGSAPAAAPLNPAVEEQVKDKPRHFACFDGLRAIAAVLVLLLHTSWVSGFTLRSSLGIYLGRLEIGVSIFFLISGFLLYRPFALSHLSGLPAPDSKRFWQRRLLRIVPAYWLALTILAYAFHAISLGRGWQGVVTHYFFLQIYFPMSAVNGIPQAWSLCTEMSFYLFLPFYAAAVARRRRSARHQLHRELVGLAVLIVFSFVFRYWALHIPIAVERHGHLVPVCAPNCGTDPPLSTLLSSWLPSYLDLFALGMLLAVASAWYTEHGTEPRWLSHRLVPWVSWAGAAFAYWAVSRVVNDAAIIYIVEPHVNLERQELYGLFAFLLLVPAVFGPQDQSLIRRALCCWPVASLGVISYGIYLWHLNLIYEFLDWTGWEQGKVPYGILALSVLAVSVAFASASYFILERPILRYKNRMVWWNRVSGRFRPLPVEGADKG